MGDKKKAKIQASEVIVNSRALDNVLRDLAEQIKANEARDAERAAQVAARTAQIEERTARLEGRGVFGGSMMYISQGDVPLMVGPTLGGLIKNVLA